jgi:hypothetical protein
MTTTAIAATMSRRRFKRLRRISSAVIMNSESEGIRGLVIG